MLKVNTVKYKPTNMLHEKYKNIFLIFAFEYSKTPVDFLLLWWWSKNLKFRFKIISKKSFVLSEKKRDFEWDPP